MHTLDPMRPGGPWELKVLRGTSPGVYGDLYCLPESTCEGELRCPCHRILHASLSLRLLGRPAEQSVDWEGDRLILDPRLEPIR